MTYLLEQIDKYLQRLTDEQRQALFGVALTMDPLPEQLHHICFADDEDAFWSDWKTVGDEMTLVIRHKYNERVRASR